MHTIALVSLLFSATAGASAMTLVHRDSFVARNATPIIRSSSADFTGGHATWYSTNFGACGTGLVDSSLYAALQTERYGDLSGVSPNCGRSITVTNTDNGRIVVVTVADACPICGNENDLDLSKTAFVTISSSGLDAGILPIVWHYND